MIRAEVGRRSTEYGGMYVFCTRSHEDEVVAACMRLDRWRGCERRVYIRGPVSEAGKPHRLLPKEAQAYLQKAESCSRSEKLRLRR